MHLIEMIGYLASLIVAISLMMSSVLKLRLLNLAGSLVFSIYGFIIKSYPVGFLNLFICIVNIYYLFKMVKTEEYFSLIEVYSNSPFLKKFLEFYGKDIRKFFPKFYIDTLIFKDDFNNFSDLKEFKDQNYGNIRFFFILRDLVPAGLIIIEKKEKFDYIHLDYVIQAYRDFKIANFLFIKNKNYFYKNGYLKLRTHASHNLHVSYLKKIGFKKIDTDQLGEIYEMDLSN